MIKEKTLSVELSHENPLGDGYFYTSLDMPAAEHEIRDAIHRARIIGRENAFRSIGILECEAWPDLLYYRLDSPTIDELNFFAKRLAQMSDGEKAIFRTVAPRVLGSPADDLLSMKDLINCTYGYDEVMIASNIRTDEQLGQFIIENELHDDVNSIPESAMYLLDKAKIGALYCESFNCTLTDGYAVFAGDYEMPEVYDGKQLPETAVEDWFAFRMQVAPAPLEDVCSAFPAEDRHYRGGEHLLSLMTFLRITGLHDLLHLIEGFTVDNGRMRFCAEVGWIGQHSLYTVFVPVVFAGGVLYLLLRQFICFCLEGYSGDVIGGGLPIHGDLHLA